MLKARSHKGEIIITTETRIDQAAQWSWRQLRMGYAHTVVVTRGEHSCKALRAILGDYTGCVWFDHEVAYPPPSAGGATTLAAAAGVAGAAGGAAAAAGGAPVLPAGRIALFFEDVNYAKLELMLLVLRLGGYNVLAMDTDTLMIDDFYFWMNTEDYKGYQLLSQVDGMGTLNIGFMYARGASPSGPVTWSLAEALLRNIRWREQPAVVAGFNGSMSYCWDQSVVTDTVYSALAGRPLFWRCLDIRPLDRMWNLREDGLKAFLAANNALIAPALKTKRHSMERPGPACHWHTSGAEGLKSQEGVMTLPHFKGEWPEALGGRALGEMTPVARAFLAMLRESGTAMWPDLEDPSTQAAAAAVPSERFAYFSAHIVCDWSGCGMNGMFLPQMRPNGTEPCNVAAHFVVSPDKPMGKRFQLLHNGAFSFPLAHLLHGPGGAYFATNVHAGGGGGGGAHHSARAAAGLHHSRLGQHVPLPRVIALAPGVISRTPSAAGEPPGSIVLAGRPQLVDLMAALSTVAVAAGRTLAVPQLSCDFPWMHRGGAFPYNGSHYVPWRYLNGGAFAPYGPSIANMSCEWFAWVQHGCLHGPLHVERRTHGHGDNHVAARMLLSIEMEHFLEQLPAEARAVRPGPGGNVLDLPPAATAAAPAGPDGVVNVTSAALGEALKGIAPDVPVVWLTKPMRVTDLAGATAVAHQQWMNHCCGLIWPHGYNRICFWEF
ncbi:hypothetical protein HXX76_005843 [Chlamydomonas incerta]|uniref:Nucleotide-diphospho-sugar transferase domain-containing protein n=1 Tax=Chlamydomonas incerta TaxID=51695 RepID=A0A835TB88_CHLIN|nr:hypothetical protein HXX76_005843 [Chlamydomonas incerta]|eukprot:KAG2437179.1 hypothetical protein HXX76_005843 [Chlamydomonas incerta]